jgi:hypothetical protein
MHRICGICIPARICHCLSGLSIPESTCRPASLGDPTPAQSDNYLRMSTILVACEIHSIFSLQSTETDSALLSVESTYRPAHLGDPTAAQKDNYLLMSTILVACEINSIFFLQRTETDSALLRVECFGPTTVPVLRR